MNSYHSSSSSQIPPQNLYGDEMLSATHDRTLEYEQKLLEQRLQKQKRESEEDSRWLQEEEINLVSLFRFYYNFVP